MAIINATTEFVVKLLKQTPMEVKTAASRLPSVRNGPDYYIEMAGIDFHYQSISRGVVDTRDLIYFFSVILLFLTITYRNLVKR